ncbi:biopolymer transporter ExbD [Ruficoccus sp. ZRK36]|jgi:biopolymer transport protein ExbD|uniref:ExbD/TolR family protein n=1 Tax=Ruficoccus sp. ZRK36 TaxID=2866311 RepID=UPI001C72BEB6|nr:biopolymer transporter ExbD [Ruficoccus sp. ZRK36]QYY34628.1 biopolymer transporter ExbD [Ruficoccus sp. ZRK36]
MTPAFSEPSKKKARIEIIPLIDVIFFLLATFILFTLSLDKLQTVPVDLPQVSPNASAEAPKDDEIVVLQVSEGGTAYWNRELIAAAEIPARLTNYKNSAEVPTVLISSDTLARYGDVIGVLDQVRLAGIERISIETIDRPAGR